LRRVYGRSADSRRLNPDGLDRQEIGERRVMIPENTDYRCPRCEELLVKIGEFFWHKDKPHIPCPVSAWMRDAIEKKKEVKCP
jgi:hypothetical protein